MFKKYEIHLRGSKRKTKIIHIDIHMRILLQMFFKKSNEGALLCREMSHALWKK